jgi:hypothetical protein
MNSIRSYPGILSVVSQKFWMRSGRRAVPSHDSIKNFYTIAQHQVLIGPSDSDEHFVAAQI